MTYPIGNVIFGCPFPHGNPEGKRFQELLENWLGHDDFDVLGDGADSFWEFLYSASPDMDPAGYFGMELYVADGYWEMDPEWFTHPPSPGIVAAVENAWADLPLDVRDALGKPKLAIAWSDS